MCLITIYLYIDCINIDLNVFLIDCILMIKIYECVFLKCRHYCHVLFLYFWFLFSINFKAICVYYIEFHFLGISLVF